MVICTKCKIEKEEEEFYKKKLKNGVARNTRCKKCLAVIGKKYKDSNREKSKEYQKEYFQENKKKIYNYKKGYFQNNPEAKLTNSIRNKVANEIVKGIRFMTSTMKYLGCNFNEYSEYLENQFDKNMSWGNYGEYWEIDHIIPLSKGGSFHYTNTQPLTVEENRKKKDSLDVV
jgi:5-methylcytosine-specific restriction endonuclease McrA